MGRRGIHVAPRVSAKAAAKKSKGGGGGGGDLADFLGQDGEAEINFDAIDNAQQQREVEQQEEEFNFVETTELLKIKLSWTLPEWIALLTKPVGTLSRMLEIIFPCLISAL